MKTFSCVNTGTYKYQDKQQTNVITLKAIFSKGLTNVFSIRNKLAWPHCDVVYMVTVHEGIINTTELFKVA